MNSNVIQLEWFEISIGMLPMIAVVIILFRWSDRGKTAIYSIVRMLIQLVAIGYFLVFIFNATDAWIICLVLAVMLVVASWISLGPISKDRQRLYPLVLASLAIGGGVTLITVAWGVLRLDPWYTPTYLVPLAGMIFANSMNTLSLSAERFEAEISNHQSIDAARRIALQTGMIPVINSMFAVGLVALPGMMTGQILSGVSPLVAVRYQIMVMSMLFAASGLSTAVYLSLVSRLNRTTPSGA